MVTGNQIARGIIRGIHAAERSAARAQRQRLAYEKAAAKQAALAQAQNDAEAHARLLSLLTCAHQRVFQRLDWETTANAEFPADATRRSVHEEAAQRRLEGYRPSWFAKTFGGAVTQRSKLVAAVRKAVLNDAEQHEADKAAVEARRTEIMRARSILQKDQAACKQALEQHLNLRGVAVEGLSLFQQDGRIIALVDGLDLEDIPTHSVTLLQSGKISTKPFSAAKIQELHRDNICSSAMAVAIEFLKVLPHQSVEVIVSSDLLDPGTGHITPQPVFYVAVTGQALSTLNLKQTEATALALRLGAQFDWHKRDGLRPIDLTPFNVPPEGRFGAAP